MSAIMQRRAFIAVMAGAAIAPCTHVARAQDADRRKRIGILIPFADSDRETRVHLKAFREELERLGWTEGRNFQIDLRWGAGNVDRIQAAARELAALRPDVILSRSTPVTTALLRETRAIPIVFVVVSDPVGDKLVSSVARPGGNVTGFTNVEASLGGKWLGLLREIAPGTSRIAAIFDPRTSPSGGSYYLRLIESTAASTATQTIAIRLQDAASIPRVIGAFAREPNGGLLVLPDAFTGTHRELIIAAAAEHKLPAVFAFRYIVAEGGLASYGVDVTDLFRRAAAYVDRILRGEKAGDLPVQAPVKFELAINLKTAKALGLTVPPTLLGIADEVIE